MQKSGSELRHKGRLNAAIGGMALLLGACSQPIDYDLRNRVGGFSTSVAAQTATGRLPAPDSRGVISYPTYQVAVARSGDTIADVAARVGLPADELAEFNVIDPNRALRQGEVIALPRRVSEPQSTLDIAAVAGAAIDSAPSGTPTVESSTLTPALGTTSLSSSATPAATATPVALDGREPIRHKVARGETAYTIARLYDVPVRALAEWNGLGTDFAVREGQFLLIPLTVPGGAPVTETAAVTQPGQGSPTPTPPSATQPLPEEQVAPASTPAPEVTGTGGVATSASQSGVLSLPVQGRIVRDFERGRNNGISIAGGAKAPVKAAADGTVAGVTQDTNRVSIVILEHSGGLLTIYVGLDEISVAKGDRVSRGQTIAALPDDNSATLHFEVREGIDNVVDPNRYLN